MTAPLTPAEKLQKFLIDLLKTKGGENIPLLESVGKIYREQVSVGVLLAFLAAGGQISLWYRAEEKRFHGYFLDTEGQDERKNFSVALDVGESFDLPGSKEKVEEQRGFFCTLFESLGRHLIGPKIT